MGRSISTVKKFIILVFVFLLCFALGLAFGSIRHAAVFVIFELRLPRVLAAALGGCGLAVSGLLLQTVTGNALCAPNIIGINSGAGLGVLLLYSLCPALWKLSPLAAFAGALLVSVIVIGVARAGAGEISKTTLILSGVAMGAFANAGISFLLLLDPDAASNYSSFQSGGFKGVQFDELLFPFLIVSACLILSIILAGRIKILLLGDGIAGSLGINAARLRIAVVMISAALAAAVISYAGLIGFVGLVVPHISRALMGQDIRKNIFSCTLIGSSLMILSDLLGRVLFAPSELPAGIVTAAIGAPFFIYLVCKRRYNQ